MDLKEEFLKEFSEEEHELVSKMYDVVVDFINWHNEEVTTHEDTRKKSLRPTVRKLAMTIKETHITKEEHEKALEGVLKDIEEAYELGRMERAIALNYDRSFPEEKRDNEIKWLKLKAKYNNK